jgi:hypothetical protein
LVQEQNNYNLKKCEMQSGRMHEMMHDFMCKYL